MPWITLWLLAAILVLVMVMVALAAADWGNPDRKLPRRPVPLPRRAPARTPRHATWTGQGETTRLGKNPPPPRPLRWPGDQ